MATSSKAKSVTKPAGNPAEQHLPAIRGKTSLVARIAHRYNVDADKMLETLRGTAFRPIKIGDTTRQATNEELMALLVVADTYHLNPFTKEIYAFPQKGGGIVPIVGVDGWIRIIQEHPQFRSIAFEPMFDGEKSEWSMRCIIERKDREKPFVVEEYYEECFRDTDPWRTMPRRMLRWKALIQCGRVAFGFGGIHDPDEGERIADSMAIDGQSTEVKGKPLTQEPRARQIEHQATQAPGLELSTSPANFAEELMELVDRTGIPENALFAKFDVGGFDEIVQSEAKRSQALEYLKGLEQQ